MKSVFLLVFLFLTLPSVSFAESRSAQDMAKECRVALDVFQGHVEKTFDNALFTGECIGYIQGAGDVSLAMADNVKSLRSVYPKALQRSP
jgi:hypothetical protein